MATNSTASTTSNSHKDVSPIPPHLQHDDTTYWVEQHHLHTITNPSHMEGLSFSWTLPSIAPESSTSLTYEPVQLRALMTHDWLYSLLFGYIHSYAVTAGIKISVYYEYFVCTFWKFVVPFYLYSCFSSCESSWCIMLCN